MFVLGLVGTPAAGKSTVAAYLAKQGAEWIDADRIAKSCLDLPDVISTLAGRFGSEILNDGGLIDRAALADRVFAAGAMGRESLRFLESVVHPLTRTEIHQRLRQAAGQRRQIALLDVPLLFESGWDLGCDAIWCVDAEHRLRVQRVSARGWNQAELDRRESNQMAIETKCRLSQVVMRNDATLGALHENLRCHWQRLAKMMEVEHHLGPPTRGRHCLTDWP